MMNLKMHFNSSENLDESTNEFITCPELDIELEHSLYAISLWEAKWCKAFLGTQEKSREELIDYVRCMAEAAGYEIPAVSLKCLTTSQVNEINKYIERPMTATVINKKEGRPNHEVLTSELIYYWMVASKIPFTCEHWPLNRLIMLVRICDIKNTPPKKMSKSDLMNRNRSLNAARRSRLGSSG